MKNIIEKAIKGDKKAFEKLYEISKKQVYFTCLGIVKNKSDAEDITQEVYITVLKKLSELSNPESFQAWVNRIAVTKSLKFIRKNRETSLDEELEKNSIADEELILPDDYVNNKEKRKIIMNIIMNKLSDVQRQTIILYYFDDFSAAKISEAMECPVGTVTYRLSSARKLIKSEILSYEKKNNDKLHALVPFSLGAFLKKQSETIYIPKIKIPKHSGISVTSVSKTALALAIPVIAVGGITTAVKLSDKNNTVPSAIEYTETIAENIKNTDTIITETTETLAAVTTTKTDTATALITTTTSTSISTSTSTSTTEEIITEIYTEAPEIYYTETESFTETSEPEIYYSEVSETEIPTETTVTTTVSYDDILEKVESYQEKFFEHLEIRETPDHNDLSTEEKYQLVNSIYTEVESLIPQDNEYYQRYINVIPELEANHYGYIDVPDDYYYNPTTVYDIQSRAFEELLNSEYDCIKNQIPEEDFIRLEESQAKWKEDRENFINILPVIASPHVEYATAEMNKFRCLVLMLYLE